MYEYDCDVSAQGDGGCRAQAVQLPALQLQIQVWHLQVV